MTKISRNEPCPCGSGKKYKKCCIAQENDFSRESFFEEEDFFDNRNSSKVPPNPAREFLKSLMEDISKSEFSSIDELNDHLKEVSAQQNSMAQLSFMGLSPEQMHIVLYAPFSLKSDYFCVRIKDKEKLKQIPLMQQALYFLEKLQESGPMKATQKGNLPRAFVREFYEVFFSEENFRFLPNKEEDLSDVVRLRRILTYAGLIKFRTGKFSLTKKGESLISKEETQEIFEKLFYVFVTKWNWGYADGYSDFWLMQQSVIFNLYLLKKKAQGWTQAKELGRLYLNAFPMLLEEARHGFSEPEKEVISTFCLRFLERVCVPLGFLERKGEGDIFKRSDQLFKVTDFFNESIEFNL
jgi:hypothetical protein